MKRMIMLQLLLASTVFCAKHAAAQAVHVGYSAKVLTYLPLFVAQERGFYAAEGLKTELHRASARTSVTAKCKHLHYSNMVENTSWR